MCRYGAVEVKHIVLPPNPREFKDIFVIFELMETDLHQVIKANDDLTHEHHQFFLYQVRPDRQADPSTRASIPPSSPPSYLSGLTMQQGNNDARHPHSFPPPGGGSHSSHWRSPTHARASTYKLTTKIIPLPLRTPPPHAHSCCAG